MIRYAVATTGVVFLPLPMIHGYFQQQALWYCCPTFTNMVEDASNSYWFIRWNPWLRADFWIRRKVESAYKILEETLKIVKETTVALVIKVCELLGIETTNIIQGFANMVGDVALHATILAIFSILLYLLYKLIISLTKKQELEVEEGEYDRERFRRKTKTKRAIRRLKQETDYLLCRDCTTQREIQIMGDTFEYHHDKENNDLFKADFIDLIEEYIDDEDTYVGSIYQSRGECSLISIYSAEEPLTIKESRICWYGQKQHPLLNDKKAVCIHIQCKSSNIREEIIKILSGYKLLKITEFVIDFAITYSESEVLCDLIIFGLRAVREDRLNHITKANIAECSKYANNFNMDKIDQDPRSIPEIIQTEAMQNAVAIGTSIKDNFQVQLSTCHQDYLDSENFKTKSFGFGHKNLIVTNAHVVEVGKLVRFHKTTRPTTSLNDYHLAIVLSRDPIRDLAILRILNKEEARAIVGKPLFKMSTQEIKFGDLTKHLYSQDTWEQVVNNTPVIVDFPKTGITVPAIARCRETRIRNFSTESGKRDYVEISGFIVDATYSKPGDCGGYVVATKDRYESKMIGFHSASGSHSWFGSVLTKEDLRELQVELRVMMCGRVLYYLENLPIYLLVMK
jgi:hypothetical protein